MPYLKTVTTGCLAVVFALPVCCFPLRPVKDVQEWLRENQILRIQICTEDQRVIIIPMEFPAHGGISGSTIQDNPTIQGVHEISKDNVHTLDDKEGQTEATTEEPKKWQQQETSNIIQEYQTLEDAFFSALRQKDVGISVDEVAKHLKEFPEYHTLRTAEDIQEFVTKGSPFYDYDLLKYMIECTGSQGKDLKQKLQEYEMKFNTYAERPIMECPIESVPSVGHGRKMLKVALDSNLSVLTLEKVKELKYQLCTTIGLPVHTIRLISIERPCILIFEFVAYEQPIAIASKGFRRIASNVFSFS